MCEFPKLPRFLKNGIELSKRFRIALSVYTLKNGRPTSRAGAITMVSIPGAKGRRHQGEGGGRFDIASKQNCADAIWRQLVAGAADARTDISILFGGRLERTDILDGEVVEVIKPTARFIIYAVKQWLDGPEFLENTCAVPNELNSVQDFDDYIAGAIGNEKASLKPKPGIMWARHLTGIPSTQKEIELSRRLLRHKDAMEVVKTAVCGLVNAGRGEFSPPLTVAQIFENVEVKGIDAIVSLRSVLMSGVPDTKAKVPNGAVDEYDRREWLKEAEETSNRQFNFYITDQNDPRHAMLNQLCDHLFLPGRRHQLVNCYASGMRNGLTALASELFKPEHRASRGSHRPILYLALHGRGPQMPKDSFEDLVYEIWSFFSDIERRSNPDTADDRRARREDSRPRQLNDIVTLLGSVRQLMARYPAVIIFDGYRGTANDETLSLHNLLSAISGDRVLDLIERLTFVPTPGATGPIDVAKFGQTRFLILGEKPLYEDASSDNDQMPIVEHPVLRLVKGISIEVLRPAVGARAELMPLLGYQAPEEITYIRTKIGKRNAIDAAALARQFRAHCQTLETWAGPYPFSESIYGVLSTLIMLQQAPPRHAPRVGMPTKLLPLITNHLIPAVKVHPDPAWRVFLHIIAIAPGGVRPKTLARVYEHYCEAAYGPDERPTRQDINQSLVAMLETMNAIVAVLRSDYSGRLHDRNLPLLYRNEPSYGVDEIACDRAIQFQFEELRTAFLKDAAACAANKDDQYISLLHFLLAEEAYEQFTHLARFESGAFRESIYEYDRLLAAIFHGAASLHDENMTVVLPYAGVGRLLPDNPGERWIALYYFLYRRLLDRAPAHDIIRRYDTAQLKVDILLALARPQLCRGKSRLGDAGWILPDPVIPVQNASSRYTEIKANPQKDFAFELRHAATAASRVIDVDWHGSGMLIEHEATKRLDIAEKILALSDNASFDADAMALSDQIMNQIATNFEKNLAPSFVQFMARRVRSRFDQQSRKDLLSKRTEAALVAKSGVEDDKLHLLAQYLELYAEVLGIEADTEYGRQIGKGEETKPGEAVLAKFIQSFAAFYVADVLRRHIFSIFPHHRGDTPRGRAGRGFVRVSVKLERFSGLCHDGYRGPGYFWRFANHILDDLTRHLGQYPRERAALLMLNATVTRHTVTQTDSLYTDYLAKAQECLSVAEPLILKLGMHSRQRQRFALERCKLMIEWTKHTQGEKRKRYGDIAESDIQTLNMLVSPTDALWQSHIRSQMQNLKDLGITG
jgi:hypothetical protein